MSAWDGIDEFIAVVSTGSFSRGARSIGKSPTHISRSIMQLERRVQAQLLHRTTRTLRLTETGQTFFDRCVHLAQERDEAMALISQEGEPQGHLRVTCSTTMGERYVAPIVRQFVVRHPNLSATIDLTNRVVDLVSEGYDLGIRTGIVSDTRLVKVQVASRTLLTCASADYLKTNGRPQTLEALAHHHCLVGTSPTWHFQGEGQSVEYRPRGRFSCNSGQAVIEACAAGFGICQLPDFYVLPFLQSGAVKILLEEAQPKDEPIWAVYPRRQHLLPKLQRLLDLLQQDLGLAISSARVGAARSTPWGDC